MVLDVKGKVLFVIKSATHRGFAREIIRRTWASVRYLEGYKFTSVFVMGEAKTAKERALIDEEEERYKDILQLNVSDEYRYFICLFNFERNFADISSFGHSQNVCPSKSTRVCQGFDF